MATRRFSCSWCGSPYLVQFQGQWLFCQVCHRYTDYNSLYNHVSIRGNFGYGVQGATYQPSLPTAHVTKRALLCGVSYKGQNNSLKGSINDVMSMKKLLIQRFAFPESSILMLTEEGGSTNMPTKRNIRNALRWLIQGCQSGDSLVFHYSGHGSHVLDQNFDELDGYDECLLPVDYQTEGRILDDELNATIVRPLPTGATLHCIIDSCFCGTLLDLPNVCRIIRDGYYKWESHQMHAYKGTSGGNAISISACDDTQNSGDSTYFTGAPMGVLTYSFIETLKQQPRLTYGNLLNTIRNRIEGARRRMGLRSDNPKLSQEPVLSSAQKFDINSTYFSL